MSKSAIIGVIVVVVVLVGGGILLANHKNSNNMNGMNMSSTTSSNSSSSTATATNSVTIENFTFSPANITVKHGTTVTWTNKDSTAHTVTETDGQNGPKSSDIQPGKSFIFTFDTPGTYKYDCSIHTQMVGTVTVTQ